LIVTIIRLFFQQSLLQRILFSFCTSIIFTLELLVIDIYKEENLI
jgi:hypothetical protein